MNRQFFLSLLMIANACLWSSCIRKDELFTDDPSAQLSFSEDELLYDTLYAGIDYPTRRIRVYNRNSGALAVSEVSLAGGASSPFSLIVNGQQGPVVRDLELLGGDSLQVIIDLSFASQSEPLPYLIEDSIRFVCNGRQQWVTLRAVGRDAQLIAAGDLPCTTTWDDSQPIVLLGETVVPAGCTLTVSKGAQVLGSRGSSLDVKGTLLVNGEHGDSVYFGGLVSGKNPGQWLGIRFHEGSTASRLSWFRIENAQTGISFVTSGTPSVLTPLSLDHGIINDMTRSALDLSYMNVQASNCLFLATAESMVRLSQAGTVTFRYCSWAGYSYDYYRNGPSLEVRDATSLTLKQCIVWGDQAQELSLASSATALADTCLLKYDQPLAGTGNLMNQDPLFVSPALRNFNLDAGSPAVDRAEPSDITDDLNGNLRDATPDLGCYERQP